MNLFMTDLGHIKAGSYSPHLSFFKGMLLLLFAVMLLLFKGAILMGFLVEYVTQKGFIRSSSFQLLGYAHNWRHLPNHTEINSMQNLGMLFSVNLRDVCI